MGGLLVERPCLLSRRWADWPEEPAEGRAVTGKAMREAASPEHLYEGRPMRAPFQGGSSGAQAGY